jgi:hypothetical protein
MISKNKTAATAMYQIIQELFLFGKLLIKDFYFIDVGFITAINCIGPSEWHGRADVALPSKWHGRAGLYCKLFTEQYVKQHSDLNVYDLSFSTADRVCNRCRGLNL